MYYNNITKNKTIYPFRFKTELEFEDEFGYRWYDIIQQGWVHDDDDDDDDDYNDDSMDYLFGNDFEVKDTKNELIDYYKNHIGYYYNNKWSISKQMIIENIQSIDYNKPKQLVYEEVNYNKYDYYIKTENELIEEYGINWNFVIDAAWSKDHMNYLFGSKLELNWYKYSLDKNGEIQGEIHVPTDDPFMERGYWIICKNLIKRKKTNIDYNKPKQLIYENRILKFNQYKNVL